MKKREKRRRVKKKKKCEKKMCEKENESEKRKNNKKSGKKKESFYAKKSDVKVAVLARQSMIVLLYKEARFSTDELNPSLSSVI